MIQEENKQHEEPILKQLTPIFVERMLNPHIMEQMWASLGSNITTGIGIALIYGIYMLAGEYLDTFVFTFIFATNFSMVKKIVLNKIQNYLLKDEIPLNTTRLIILNNFRFSITFKMIILIYEHLTSLDKIWKTLIILYQKLSDATLIPHIFIFYLVVFKLQLHLYIIILDLILLFLMSFIKGVVWMFLKSLDLVCKSQIQPMKNFKKRINDQIIKRKRVENLVISLKSSSIFNNILFCTISLVVLITMALSFLLCYHDVMNYKEQITPIILQLNLTELGISQYLTPDYMLKQLGGSYISPELTLQLRYCIMNFQEEGTASQEFIQIFYGDEHKYMRKQLNQCKNSLPCQIKVLSVNYDRLNTEVYEYVENGFQYFKTILPQIKTIIQLILSFLLSAFEGSMSYIFKFMLFQQGVLYMMNESPFKVKKVKDFLVHELGYKSGDKLIQNLNNQITGVFVALTQISFNHFMLSYVIFDIMGIQLSFILSCVIAILSLTQIISPGVFFGIVVFGWYITGSFIEQFQQTSNISFVTFLLSTVCFFIFSNSTYTTCYYKHLGDPFWTGISVILGYISFQWKGIIYGPLLIGIIRALGHLLDTHLMESNEKRQKLDPQHFKSSRLVQIFKDVVSKNKIKFE